MAEQKISKITLLVIPSDTYQKSILTFIKKINKKICYVTINKDYGTLTKLFRKNKINLQNFFFIDCITKAVTDAKNEPNCVYISSPNALTSLSLAISKSIDSSCPMIFIDSLSNLLIFHKSGTLIRFIHYLINKVRHNPNVTLVLAITEKDKESKLYNSLGAMVDEVIELES